nr:hypothetical protein [Azospirillum picis]
MNRAGRITVGGQEVPVTVDNASEGGAQVSGVPQGVWDRLAEGTPLHLVLPGLEPVAATVRTLERAAGGRLHVTFIVPDVERDRFVDRFRRLAAGLVPLDQAA